MTVALPPAMAGRTLGEFRSVQPAKPAWPGGRPGTGSDRMRGAVRARPGGRGVQGPFRKGDDHEQAQLGAGVSRLPPQPDRATPHLGGRSSARRSPTAPASGRSGSPATDRARTNHRGGRRPGPLTTLVMGAVIRPARCFGIASASAGEAREPRPRAPGHLRRAGGRRHLKITPAGPGAGVPARRPPVPAQLSLSAVTSRSISSSTVPVLGRSRSAS